MISLDYEKSPLLENVTFCKHGFFSRQGGASKGPFESLNCKRFIGDLDEHVLENRERIAKALGFEEKNLITLNQIHTDVIRVVDNPLQEEIEGDSLITFTPGLLLAVQTADCVPILLASSYLVAAVHSGWRGTLLNIVGKTIQTMQKLGVNPNEIVANIGPCINLFHYEIQENVAQQFEAQYKKHIYMQQYGYTTKTFLDLRGLIKEQIENAGVSQIWGSQHDTFSNEHYFSARRSALQCKKGEPLVFGCQLSVIGLV